ncbi:alanine racemase [Streptomyces sp. B1866]|uniref:alanine racemase n=1 Tax=Streptomyces sp. B1866 TaxID=3075431 RepID=UPI00288D0977|nr:alanine racemase [Streptomyces sp. B1866]MDT3395104.1 alanine racemase [Streptomyces sp. B1866]
MPAYPDPELDAVLGGRLPHDLAYALGGPYHLLLPGRFDANVAAFRAAFAEAGVDGRVYYAKKANKAAVWIERCAAHGIGTDVASLGELREALGHGVRGEDTVVTGPAKSDDLLRVAVLQGCLVAVDALDELERITATARATGRTARVLLRRLPPEQPHSRFGLTGGELGTALDRCRADDGAVRVEGFSFHLSGYAVQPRADLAGELVELCRTARAMGLSADRISIGGGFAVDYVAAGDWARFLEAHDPADYHARKSFNVGDFYPYHSPVAGADALRAVLAARPGGTGAPLADRLRAAGVTLLVEPGRALLDRAGCTVFRVQGVKERGTPAGTGYGILTVDGTSLSLSEQWFNSEYLPDPVLLPAADRPTDRAADRPADGRTPADDPADDPAGTPFRACVGGASCLESDLLTWRKIAFPVRPAPGDLLVYPNTAGYQMDSNESPFHDLPLPPKVVIETTGEQPRWRLDRRPPS